MARGTYKRRSPVNDDGLTEHDEQVRVVVYLHKTRRIVFAVPNGGKRNQIEGKRLKDEGVSPGVPDLFIPMARKGFHGLFIEMKRVKGGIVSDNQEYWIEQLQREGYAVHVCKGHDEAIKVIEEYFA